MPHKDPDALRRYKREWMRRKRLRLKAEWQRRGLRFRDTDLYKRGRVSINRWRDTHREKVNASCLDYQQRLKAEFVAAYGGCCTCCGEARIEFMSVQHVNGDGKQHRASVHNARVYSDLRRRGWPKGGITVFCMNCNFATKNGRECPHELERRSRKFLTVATSSPNIPA